MKRYLKAGLSRSQKIAILFFSVLIAVRIAGILFWGEIDQTYVGTTVDMTDAELIPCENVRQDFQSGERKLDQVELMFTGIADDRAGKIIMQIFKGDKLLYKTGISLTNINNDQWKNVTVNLLLNPEETYTLELNAEGCSAVPQMYMVSPAQAGAESIAASQNGEEIEGRYALRYIFCRWPSRTDRLLTSVLWLAVWLGLSLVIINFYKVKKRIQNSLSRILQLKHSEIVLAIIQLCLCYLILHDTDFEYQVPVKALLYFLSFFSAFHFQDRWASVSSFLNQGRKQNLFVILMFYSAFALVGQRIFLFPLNTRVGAPEIILYLLCVIWVVPLLAGLLQGMRWFGTQCFVKAPKMKTIHFFIVSSLVLVIPCIIALYAFNPAISSPDTQICMINNAHFLYGMADWHPFFYCLVLHCIQKVWDSTYAVVLVQCFFWVYVVEEGLFFLRKKGFNERILLALAVLLGFSASNVVHVVTIWKDIQYSLSLLWAMILLAKLTMDYDYYKSKGRWYIYVELVIALIGVHFYRKNGIVPYVLILFGAFFVLRKSMKAVVALFTTIIVVLAVRYPLYNHFAVQDLGNYGIYIGLGQDILGVYYAKGEVSEDTMAMVTQMTGFNNAEYAYYPTWSNASYHVEVTPGKFVANYMDTFLRNPVIMIRAVLCREDCLWNIFEGKEAVLGCVNYTQTMDGMEGYNGRTERWNDFYPARQENSFTVRLGDITSYTAENQLLQIIEWRSGLITLIAVVAISMFFLRKKGKHILTLAVPAGHILSLLLSTGWSDFRYFWPLNLMNIFMVMFAMYIYNHQNPERPEAILNDRD